MDKHRVTIRTGKGTVLSDGTFNDVEGYAHRIIRHHAGWQSVTFQKRRYQLMGGVRTDMFICLNRPIG